MSLIAVCGDCGSGKTRHLTYCAIQEMTAIPNDNWLACRDRTRFYNSQGNNYPIPSVYKHTVFANYYIRSEPITCKPRERYEIDGYKLGLDNPQHKTQYIPPFAHIFLTEAQRFYNARESWNFADFVSRFYETHRHFNINVMFDIQRFDLLDKNIRLLISEFIFIVDSLDKTDKYGNVILSKWTVLVLHNLMEAQQYSENGILPKHPEYRNYSYKGNIYKTYNSYEFEPLHLSVENRDTEIRTGGIINDYSPSGIIQYNKIHTANVPVTFKKTYKGDKI